MVPVLSREGVGDCMMLNSLQRSSESQDLVQSNITFQLSPLHLSALPRSPTSIGFMTDLRLSVLETSKGRLGGIVGVQTDEGQLSLPPGATQHPRVNKTWNWATVFFCWIFFIHSAGLYYFAKGFLLTRLVLDEHSLCTQSPGDVEALSTLSHNPRSDGCWHPKTFDKAVIVIIDALRYDFTTPSVNSPGIVPRSFQNAFTCLYNLARDEPHNAFLRPFIADPPTTTVQRLKGLTTGSLPTFIDAGSNFASEAIEEDNLLHQLRDAGRRIVHLGDDTWTALFPGYFEPDLSKAYGSFVVEDLHTVDNGVIEHIFPLLEKKNDWDVLIAHFLGLDHAGHEHGPNHPTLRAKLKQMDTVVRDIIHELDDDTLLVVMGDHGMDYSGNHGGESNDEIQAALWMYSRKGIFGRTQEAFLQPPLDATTRSVAQIDLVPTLALLLGVPIPFNSLGSPIEEAFVGRDGTSLENLAQVYRIAALGMERYQSAYSNSTGKVLNTSTTEAKKLWGVAIEQKSLEAWTAAHVAFLTYQSQSLQIYRGLWTSFDLISMGKGILITGSSILLLLFFANIMSQTGGKLQGDRLEFLNMSKAVLLGSSAGCLCSLSFWVTAKGPKGLIDAFIFQPTFGGIIGALIHLLKVNSRLVLRPNIRPSFWVCLSMLFVISQTIGYASNSYTIWEDNILLFYLSTFGIISVLNSLRQSKLAARISGVYQSVLFTILGWVAFYSRRCRDEQMPNCHTTYFGDSESTALILGLIPLGIAVLLPIIIKSYLSSRMYHSSITKSWVFWYLFLGLLLNALFWILNNPYNGYWFKGVSEVALKPWRVRIAQLVLVMCFPIGVSMFILDIAPEPRKKGVSIVPVPSEPHTMKDYKSAARYLSLLVAFVVPVFLVQEPLGAGSLMILVWQVLSLAELLHANSLQDHSIGPIVLGVLGSFHFFRTGHQATLSSIQWRAAFITSYDIQYPWSPLLIVLNSFGANILAAIAVPLIPLWRRSGRSETVILQWWIIRAISTHLMYYGVISLGTTIWAGLLRRHLMLYRVFCPRFMMGAVVLLIVDVVGILISLNGARASASHEISLAK